ncbi:hypothetical protein CDD82_251 [Ophiocordyceps australis]|uniref:RNA polymerase II degradation factor 1 n=1 Tax=Ophiocordyceps australis TaxID=1399860 RepID=A0A2C5ZPA4_9HYPO|nr:hypothetical protein CDD82_251 [Ophiocordyceps australis]
MSESATSSRPVASRGRGSGRAGRGGFAGRGGRRINGDKTDQKHMDDDLADEGEFGDLRKKYGDKTSVICEMFPDWSEADVLFALQETNGDQNETVARIAEGTVSQWGQVSKPKKTSRAKPKDATATVAASDSSTTTGPPRSGRGGRAVSEGLRGRGRGAERGARGGRGRSSHLPVNGTRNKENLQLSVPTEESNAWGNETSPKAANLESKTAPPAQSAVSDPPKPPTPQAKTWASMLRQSTAPKAATAPKEPPSSKPMEPPAPQAGDDLVSMEPGPAEPAEETTPVPQHAAPAQLLPTIAEPESILPPAKDELTETNLEHVADVSQPPATGTAASTAADSWDPRQSPVSASVTPLSAAQHQHQSQRTNASGFATSAMKATTERSARMPSYQRRVLDQEEAVRMPGNREVDRAAVQFGAFSINGADDDIDGDREEPETRAQPPADSPVAHPRTSLPPVSQPVALPENFSQKPAPVVPSAPARDAPTGPAAHAQVANVQQQYSRFGPSGVQEVAGVSQKPADPFSHHATPLSQPSFDNYANPPSLPQTQQTSATFNSAPAEYSNYYAATQQERGPYNVYGQQYGGQQNVAPGQHESLPGQQRPFAGYGAQNDSLNQYPQSGAVHGQPRFGGSSDSQNSGHSTPNPTAQTQPPPQQQSTQQPTQQQQAQQPQQPHHPQQHGAPGAQPQSHGQQYAGYSHPYYSNPYYHQYYSGYSQGGFGPYGKGGMYGQPYGVSPNTPYDHASSPGTFGGPSSLHRDGGLGSGLGDYGRVSSNQVGAQPGLGSGSFAGGHESFGRGSSSYQSQGQAFNNQGQPPSGSAGDDLKPFGDAKTVPGPSSSMGGGPRPGSAANAAAGTQGGLPLPQNSQMGGGYGGYPSHMQGHGLHGSGAYSMGAGSAGSQHGNTHYSYGQGFGNGSYYGGGQQQQQHQHQQQHQQQRGWGGNYH